MASYVQTCNKRQKTTREPNRSAETIEYFPGINKIEYKGESAGYDDTLCYRYYNAHERIHGRSMEDWIKPTVSFTAFRYNGFDPYGKPTFQRGWDDHTKSMDNYKRIVKAGFEFCTKLGVKHWSGYDRDLIPEMESYEDSVMCIDEMTEYIQEIQQRTGVKPLWIAPDLHSHPRYASGAGSSYDSNVFLQAAQQTKRCMEMSHKLNSECFLMWNGREGFESVLNTDIQREMKHYARLLKMTYDFKERLGYRGQLVLDPWKNKNYDSVSALAQSPGKMIEHRLSDKTIWHPYTWDVTSGLCFLKHYNLDRMYKLSVRPGYQLYLGSMYNSTTCVEISQHEDIDIKEATIMMKNIVEQGGFQPGGININIVPSRKSFDIKDMFICYISCIDTLARALRICSKMLTEQVFTKNVQQRYISYCTGFGSLISNGEATLEDCEEQVRKLQNQSLDNMAVSRNEHWDAAFQNFINKFN